jgi:phosphoserine aminotransferase
MVSEKKKINFNAGPAALPESVLQQASEAVIDYNGTGLSILEIPHRGRLFDAIMEESRALVKELCGLNEDYEVLWMQGGRLQFSMIPMNFLAADSVAGYVDSGHWAAEAMADAGRYGKVEVLASSREQGYTFCPTLPQELPDDFAYVYLTSNNTIYGTQYRELPRLKVPLVVDMSSDILSMKRDYTACSFFYAVAQKNLGTAGVTLVVIRKDMLQRICRSLPPMLDYAAHVRAGSVLNTPPVFNIYTSLLSLRWLKARGIDAVEQENRLKATMVYEALERNPLFYLPVERDSRSLMNVVFKAKDAAAEATFLERCTEHGITGVKGHRSAGGFRVSLYNAIPLTAVETLVDVLRETAETFAERTG